MFLEDGSTEDMNCVWSPSRATTTLTSCGNKRYLCSVNRRIGNSDAKVRELSSTSYLLSRIPVVITAVFLVSCLVVTPAVYADFNAFTPSTADTWVQSDDPNSNHAAEVFMQVSTDPARAHRGLVKFDLSSIPPGSTINAAYLSLYVPGYDGAPASRTYVANRITRDWIEAQATWNVYETGSNWAAPGGDYTSDGAASTPGASSGRVTWTVTDIVKAWIQGGQPNYGFLIKDAAEGTGDTWIWFSTREATENEQWPVLEVDWTPPNPVGGIVMPTNKLEILTPYLALAGLIIAVSAVVVIKRRSKD
jgi:hypothetical protein